MFNQKETLRLVISSNPTVENREVVVTPHTDAFKTTDAWRNWAVGEDPERLHKTELRDTAATLQRIVFGKNLTEICWTFAEPNSPGINNCIPERDTFAGRTFRELCTKLMEGITESGITCLMLSFVIVAVVGLTNLEAVVQVKLAIKGSKVLTGQFNAAPEMSSAMVTKAGWKLLQYPLNV
jgi:hypothetical protein